MHGKNFTKLKVSEGPVLWWERGQAACPPDTRFVHTTPPKALPDGTPIVVLGMPVVAEYACKRADGTKHGPFAQVFFDNSYWAGAHRNGKRTGTWKYWQVGKVLVEEELARDGAKDSRYYRLVRPGMVSPRIQKGGPGRCPIGAFRISGSALRFSLRKGRAVRNGATTVGDKGVWCELDDGTFHGHMTRRLKSNSGNYISYYSVFDQSVPVGPWLAVNHKNVVVDVRCFNRGKLEKQWKPNLPFDVVAEQYTKLCPTPFTLRIY